MVISIEDLHQTSIQHHALPDDPCSLSCYCCTMLRCPFALLVFSQFLVIVYSLCPSVSIPECDTGSWLIASLCPTRPA